MSKHLFIVGYDTFTQRWACHPEEDTQFLRDKPIHSGSRGWVSVAEAGERLRIIDEEIGDRLEDGMRFLNGNVKSHGRV